MSKSILNILLASILALSVVKASEDVVSAEEVNALYGNQFEGDIVLTPEQQKALSNLGRNGLINPATRWPNKIVPYQLSSSHSESAKNVILSGLKTIESISCIRFVQRTNQKDYVQITAENSGCWSFVGKINGAQKLNLQPNGCISTPTVIHEFLHALGFYHMQSTYDRDDYVIINWENIEDGTSHNFNKYTSSQVTNFGVPYDPYSIMHYFSTAFSKNGKPTIVKRNGDVIPYNRQLTESDILRLNKMYC